MTQPHPVLEYKLRTSLAKPRVRTILLLGMVSVMFVVQLAWGAGCFMTAHIWTLYEQGKAWSSTEADVGEALWEAAGMGFIPSLIVIAILLMFWMYKTLKQLQRLKPGSLRMTPGMAIWGWIIPYGCFIRPYELMRAMYAVSRGESIRKFRPLVGTWWALWLFADVVVLFGMIALSHQKASDAEIAVNNGIFGMFSSSVYGIDCVLLWIIVYRIDRGVRQLQAAVTS